MSQFAIAVIEDEPAINEMYCMKLQLEGFKTLPAFDGEEGLALIKKHKPALVLLDLKMPKMTGEEMLAKLRETKWGSEIKVVVLTNISRDEAPKSLQLLNIERYIVKAHYTPAQVVDLVRRILGISDNK